MGAANPRFGDDYDLERYSFGERDSAGHIVWNYNYPDAGDWHHIRIVTINMDPRGSGDYRNYRIHPDRPLDPWGIPEPERGPHHYDLDDLAGNALDSYGIDYGGGGGMPIEPPEPPKPPPVEPPGGEPIEPPRPPVKKVGVIRRIFRRLFGRRGR